MNPLAAELIDKLKKQNRKLNEAERQLGKAVFDSYPLTIQIEPTNRCNKNCITCARSYYDAEQNQPGDFPEELFDYLEVPFAFAESVVFGGYGEPLMGENFDALFALAVNYSCRTELITNGSLLDEPMIEFICNHLIHKIIFSVDAASDPEMIRLRGVSLSDLLDKIELIKEIAGLNTPQIAFNVTLNINNLSHLVSLVSLAASREVTEVNVVHQKIYTAAQASDSVFHHKGYAAQVFEESLEMAREQSVWLNLPPLDGEGPCYMPLEMIMIDHKGLVQGCCSSLFSGGWPKLELGNIAEHRLLDLWNNPSMQQARLAAFGRGEWPEPCSGCAFRKFDPESHLRIQDEGQNE